MHGIHRPNIQDIGLIDRPAERRTALPRATGGQGIPAALAAAVRNVADAAVRWRARRVVRTDLNALPDWALADIGLARTDIPRVADAIADTLREAGPGASGKPPKIKLQSVLRDDPLAGHVRVVSGGAPEPVGCG